jgi:hypothetical protein
MAVTPPPLITTDVSDPPNRGQEQSVFSPKMDAFLAAFDPLQTEQNALAEWMEDTANSTEGWANDADASATAAAGSASDAAAQVVLATAEKVAAQAAAAAAQAAAGLTPDADFGMVVATTANTAVKTSAYTAEVGVLQDVNTTGGGFAITPPASPTVGQWFGVRDYNQSRFIAGRPWIDYTSDKIIGLSEDCYINVNTVIFEWRGATKGWCV